MDSRQHSDEGTPRRRLTRSERRRRSVMHLATYPEFRERRNSSLAPPTERLSHDTRRENGVTRLLPPAPQPVTVPDLSCSYQPVPSTTANRDTEYSYTDFSSTRPHSEGVTLAERSQTWRLNKPTANDEVFISLKVRVYENRRAPVRLTCRFCSQDGDQETFVRVCECDNDARFAHKKCLQNAMERCPTARCQSCGHRYALLEWELPTVVLQARQSLQNSLCEKIERLFSTSCVKWTMYVICAILISLYIYIVYTHCLLITK